MDETANQTDSRYVALLGERSIAEDARQDVLDVLWTVFVDIASEANMEAAKDSPDLGRLATLVRISSQAADNYRYHAGH